LSLVSGRSPGADDGIRTRDPHLGKVPGTALLTCGDGAIWHLSSAFSIPCNPVVSRRFSVVDGTPTGPLLQLRSNLMAARDFAVPEVRIGRLAWISSTNRSLGFWNGVSDSGRPTPPACSLRQDSAQRHSALPPSAGSYPCARQWSCDGSLAGRSLRTSVASIAHSIREGSRRLADAAVSPRLLRPLRSYAGSRRAFQTCTLTRSQPTRMPASWRSRAKSSKPGALTFVRNQESVGTIPRR
jgi:hypothetical protein